MIEAHVGGLGAHQMLGNDTVHPTPGVEHRIGHQPHEADPTASVHQTHTTTGQFATEVGGRRGEAGIAPRTGPAIDAK